MSRRRIVDRLHDSDCHVSLCSWGCRCWCHDGPAGNPTLPRTPEVVRVRAAASVTVSLCLNGDPVLKHTISVMDQTIVIDPGPLYVKTTDRLTIEARVER